MDMLSCNTVMMLFFHNFPSHPPRRHTSDVRGSCGASCRATLRALLIILGLVLAALPSPVRAEPFLYPGFMTLGIWEPDPGLRLDVALWYPTRRAPFEVKYDDWTFRVARGGKPVEGLHPLILLSHDSAGSRFSLHELAGALAQRGFVVAAATHTGDSLDDMDLLFTPDQLFTRTRHLRDLLDSLLRMPETSALIDPNRIGVLGVGPGGAAALLLGGARLDRDGWAGFCARTTAQDPYCAPWTRPLLERFALTSGLGKSQRDPRIRAVAAVAPGYGMFFTPEGLSTLRTPLLLLRADLDTINRAPNHAEAIRKGLPAGLTPLFDVLEESDGASLMSPCSSTLATNLPEMCLKATPQRREKTQAQLAQRSLDFFVPLLGRPNPPPLPAETPIPELRPYPPPAPKPEPAPAPKPKSPRRR